MGIYLNPGSGKFKEALDSEIYVDKSGLIAYTNKVFGTKQKFVCVSRPRRFGKSMAADMLSAYYDRGIDSSELFRDLKIAGDSSYETYRNQYDVIKVNMQEFLSRTKSMAEFLGRLSKFLRKELFKAYPDIDFLDDTDLAQSLGDIYSTSDRKFVIIIDEWDCIFREYKEDHKAQEQYLDFLRDLLKDKNYIGLAYMTGILPIKKYGTHSALNMFMEFSMKNPKGLSDFVGFTEDEVKPLCKKYGMDNEECRA